MINERQYYSISWEDVNGKETYISPPFDSTVDGTLWHRAKVYALKPRLTVSFFASDDKNAAPDWSESYKNSSDILLYGYKGRYLQVKIEYHGKNDEAGFDKIRFYYPAHSFTRYLPAIYQLQGYDSFFLRFLAMFQSAYLDLEEKIADFPETLEPDTDNQKQMTTLADWLCLDEFELLPKEKRSIVLSQCALLYRSLGTRTGIDNVILWLSGDRQFRIIEYQQIENFIDQERIIEHYSNDKFQFTILLRKNIPILSDLMEYMKPAYTKCQLIELENRVRLDNYTYLGINSICT
jgi:phage tail-like protein